MRRNKLLFAIGQGTVILTGAATAFIAALISDQGFVNWRWLLVLLPLVGAFAATLLSQTRVREILVLRENGRQQIQVLIDTAKAAYAAAKDEAAITKLHSDLIVDVNRLETQQAEDVMTIVPGSKSGTPARPANIHRVENGVI